MSTIVWAVSIVGGNTDVAHFTDEGAAVSFCRQRNDETRPGRYQVERCHLVGGHPWGSHRRVV